MDASLTTDDSADKAPMRLTKHRGSRNRMPMVAMMTCLHGVTGAWQRWCVMDSRDL